MKDKNTVVDNKEKETDNENSFWIILKDFFINYLWFGALLVLIGIIIDLQFVEKNIYCKVAIEFLKTIGISIMIAAVFSYAANSSKFIGKFQKLLRDIVIDRNFLGNVDEKSKRNALNSLIKPSSSQKTIYSNIEDYYNVYINKTLDISKKNVRSDYTVNLNVYKDSDKSRLCADYLISYRLYPTDNGYEVPIKVGFKESDKDSHCEYIRVYNPEGLMIETIKPELTSIGENDGIQRIGKLEIKDFGKNSKHLKVEIRVTEFGEDHWIALPFQALQPTDGFKYFLRCQDSLKIVKYYTYGQGVKFFMNLNESKNELNITCTEWINEGAGSIIIVSET